MKVVIDNKIWVAYLLSQDKQVEHLLKLINNQSLSLLMSQDILEDLTTLLKCKNINQLLDKHLIENFLYLLVQKSHIIKPTHFIEDKTSVEDQSYANLATSGNAQFLITVETEFHRFEKLDGYRFINVIELKTFLENFEEGDK